MINIKHKLIFIMAIGLLGCASPKQEDFVGVWVGDSLTLELKSDGSCTVTGNNVYLLFTDTTSAKVSRKMDGTWLLEHIYVDNGRKIINLRVMNNINNCYENALIEYRAIITSYGLEYVIYADLSDPDDMNRLELKKTK